MKKLLAVLVVLALVFSVFALSACGDVAEDLGEVYDYDAEEYVLELVEETEVCRFVTLSDEPIIPHGEPVFVPILMYHTSSEEPPRSPLPELYVRPSEFERQLIWLNENNFTFITFDDWDNLNYIYNPIMLTFDDGYLENYTEIFPLLQRHNARITLFLTVGLMDMHGLTEEMVRTMSDSGYVKFEAHSMTHPDLTTITADSARMDSELRVARERIEEMTGLPVLVLAYPAGQQNAAVREWTARYYRFGLRHEGGMHNTSVDDFGMLRIRINRSTSLETFARLVTR